MSVRINNKKHDYVHIIYELLINIEIWGRRNSMIGAKKEQTTAMEAATAQKKLSTSATVQLFSLLYLCTYQRMNVWSNEKNKEEITRIVTLQNVS